MALPVGTTDPTDTTKAEFAQAARDRAADFHALRAAGRWTASVYLGPYVAELRLKHLICEHLRVNNLPVVLRVHDLGALLIYCGRRDELAVQTTGVRASFDKLLAIHDLRWRYRVHDPAHEVVSDDVNHWLFDAAEGIMGWLGI